MSFSPTVVCGAKVFHARQNDLWLAWHHVLSAECQRVRTLTMILGYKLYPWYWVWQTLFPHEHKVNGKMDKDNVRDIRERRQTGRGHRCLWGSYYILSVCVSVCRGLWHISSCPVWRFYHLWAACWLTMWRLALVWNRVKCVFEQRRGCCFRDNQKWQISTRNLIMEHVKNHLNITTYYLRILLQEGYAIANITWHEMSVWS